MKSCIFCSIVAQRAPASIIYEDELCLALMDIFPLRPAHVLVINKRHVQYVHELSEQERNHLFTMGNKVSQAIRQSALQPLAVSMRSVLTILFFLLLNLCNAQRIADTTINVPMVSLHFSGQLPFGDLGDRFGSNLAVG